MIELATLQATFDASPEEVFAFVTNMENYGRWFPGVVDVRAADDRPHATVGKRYRETLDLPEGRGELTIEVTDVEPARRFVTEGDLPVLLPRMTITTEPVEGGTRMTLAYESRLPGLASHAPMLAALRSDLTTRGRAGLEKLATLLVGRSV